MDYGNDLKTVKRSIIAGVCIGIVPLAVLMVIFFRDPRLFKLSALPIYLTIPSLPAIALGLISTLTTVSRVRVVDGQIQHLIFGRIISVGSVADFQSLKTTSIGPCIILKKKKMYLFALSIREVIRLRQDLLNHKKVGLDRQL